MKTLELGICKKLKDLGYDGLGIYQMFVGDTSRLIISKRFQDEDLLGIILSPTPDMAAEWLRQKHNIHVHVEAISALVGDATAPTIGYMGIIEEQNEKNMLCPLFNDVYKDYDEAFACAIEYALDMLE